MRRRVAAWREWKRAHERQASKIITLPDKLRHSSAALLEAAIATLKRHWLIRASGRGRNRKLRLIMRRDSEVTAKPLAMDAALDEAERAALAWLDDGRRHTAAELMARVRASLTGRWGRSPICYDLLCAVAFDSIRGHPRCPALEEDDLRKVGLEDDTTPD
jgi:hypothetical protein